jgi:hypothetical protein
LQVIILFMIIVNIVVTLAPALPPTLLCQCSVEWSVRPVMLHSPVSMGAGYCIIVPSLRTIAFEFQTYAHLWLLCCRFRCFDICRRLTLVSRTSKKYHGENVVTSISQGNSD